MLCVSVCDVVYDAVCACLGCVYVMLCVSVSPEIEARSILPGDREFDGPVEGQAWTHFKAGDFSS